MELKDYTTEELREELKRRNKAEREYREAHDKEERRCRNCVHCTSNPRYPQFLQCAARTWGKKYPRHYTVTRSTPACEEFKNKYQQDNQEETV